MNGGPVAAAPAGRLPGALIVALALLLGAATLTKPVHMDDAHYVARARAVAAHPATPFAGETFWYHAPEPAFTVLTPPGLLYWLAPAVWLGGDDDRVLKLALLPLAALFVVAVAVLARRFAPGFEALLLLLVVLSPAVLPSLNVMLDIPALALGLAGLALFAHAVDRSAAGLALAAGALVGCGAQVKYPALLMPAVLLAYALNAGAPRLGVLAAGAAAVLFGAVEAAVSWPYGVSHLWYHLQHPRGWPGGLAERAWWLLSHFGFLAPGILLLALAARGWRMAVLGATAALLLALLASGIVWPEVLAGLGPLARHGAPHGVLVGGATLLALAALARAGDGAQCDTRFLLSWLAIECVGALAISPFPAARRLLGPLLAASLLAAHLAARAEPAARVRRGARLAVAVSAALALLLAGVDLLEARAMRAAAETAALRAAPTAADATVWFAGHWGFQHYALRAGMHAYVEGRSRPRPGDWLVLPDAGIDQQAVRVAGQPLRLVETLRIDDPLPLRSVPWFYGGACPLAVRREARRSVRLYRVEGEWQTGP